MKNKLGFTLIELLAVIVILGVLALITVPIVNNIINNSEKSSLETSVTFYGKEIETKVKNYMASNMGKVPTGRYYTKKETEGKILYYKIDDTELSNFELEYSGNIVVCDNIEIYDNGSIYVSSCKIDDEDVDKTYGKKSVFASTLVTGSEFIKKIISLANNDAYGLTYIGFYSNGNLPEGYTKEELLKLDNISVSSNYNEINMYYDSEKEAVYVYSENQIYANEDSSNMFNRYGEINSYFDNLKEINLLDLDTSKVTDMSRMFSGCQKLKNLDLSNFDTSNVTNMEGMFAQLGTYLTTLDLSSFDTSKVTNMAFMFDDFYVKELDLSSFDTSNVTTMYGMFWGSSLTEITVSNKWVINSSTDTRYMFESCGTDHVTVK